MKRLICIAVLLIITVEFNNHGVILEPKDLFDRIMTEQYDDYNQWPERSKKAFRRKFYESRNPKAWFPDNWPEYKNE